MQLNKQAILDKTNNGINIYAHVLRQYYPGKTVLSLSGRDCQPALNPFNDDKPTLQVRIINDCASHNDYENPLFKGDAFDFAAKHYQVEAEPLLQKLNDEMHLNIGKPFNFHGNGITPPVSSSPKLFTAPTFSYFKAPVTNIIPHANLSLVQVYGLIRGNYFQKPTATLRCITDKKEARAYKAKVFDYVTCSGTFSRRTDNALINHSGLLTIDFDHIPDLQKLKSMLLRDEYFETEMMFVSPSGDGLKWIVQIDTIKHTHQSNFLAIANYIKAIYQLDVDQSGKDISRACFLPHDPEIFINPKYLV